LFENQKFIPESIGVFKKVDAKVTSSVSKKEICLQELKANSFQKKTRRPKKTDAGF
jgi:hypothetical protein